MTGGPRAPAQRPVAIGAVVALFVAACASAPSGGPANDAAAGPTPTAVTAPPSGSPATEAPAPTTLAPTTLAPSTTAPTTTEPAVAGVPGLVSLLPGHDDLSATRINLVFAGHGLPDGVDWVDYARRLLTWEGPVRVVGEESLSYGPFAIEPFRSHRELFNAWFLEDPAPTPTAYGAEGRPLPVDVPAPLVVTLAWEWTGGVGVSVPPDFLPPGLPEPGAGVFRGMVLSVRSDDPVALDGTLAHELGHAVFNLPDLYVFDRLGDDGRSNRTFYPSCAADRAEGESFWGDLVGAVDPFFETYLADHEAAGAPVDPARVPVLRRLITVGLVPDGCFGPEGVGVRSAPGGLMYDENELPVMDAVNRRWAEQVLAAWSG